MGFMINEPNSHLIPIISAGFWVRLWLPFARLARGEVALLSLVARKFVRGLRIRDFIRLISCLLPVALALLTAGRTLTLVR